MAASSLILQQRKPKELDAFNIFIVIFAGSLENDQDCAVRSIGYTILSTPECECFSISFHQFPDLKCSYNTPFLAFILRSWIKSEVEMSTIEERLFSQNN